MNKRQYKKFQKKFGCKRYKDYEYKRILIIATERIEELKKTHDVGTTIIYIRKTRKGKYLIPPKILTNVVPVGINNITHNDENHELTLEWNCKSIEDNLSEKAQSEISALKQMYESWLEGIKDVPK